MGRKYKVVLDDSLYEEYNAYKNPKNDKLFSMDKIAQILKFSGGDILTNYAQYNRINVPKDESKLSALLRDTTNKNKSLMALANGTEYKIILTDDKNKKNYPFVNINEDEIEMVLGGFIMRGMSRAKALEHIKNICADARDVVVYDSYFSGSDTKTKNNVELLTSILPTNRKLSVIYHKDPVNGSHFSERCINMIQTLAPKWELTDKVLPNHHDRYIVINGKTEIILTSGFDHINNATTEFSYIIREYNERFA